jgi:cytoskeleton protein RodZ
VSIGEALASAREERGLTVDEVSTRTRIRGTLIRAIERDDFSLCGGAVYARGHIRSIARAVGTDPEPLIAEFDAENATVPQLVTDTIFDTETKVKPERTGPRWGTAMIAAALVGVCVIAIASILGSRGQPVARGGGHPGAAASPSSPTSTPPPTHPTKPKRGSGDETLAQNTPRGVEVQIRITGARSWVSLRNSVGKTLLQRTLSHGQTFTGRDPKLLHLVIGDAGAVDLIVNGKELGPPGGRGAVVNLTFHPGNPSTTSQG